MADLIDRAAAIDAFAERVKRSNNSDFAPVPRWNDAVEIVENLPSVEPTLYGYKIEHLDLIARVLQKEDMPPERVTEALTDIGRIVAIVKEEFEESLRKAVEQCKI